MVFWKCFWHLALEFISADILRDTWCLETWSKHTDVVLHHVVLQCFDLCLSSTPDPGFFQASNGVSGLPLCVHCLAGSLANTRYYLDIY